MPPSAGGVAVVIPTVNEAAAIGGVIAALPRHIVDRIIVGDGESTDGTADVARRAGAEVLSVGKGYGRACLAGAEAADDAEIIVFMDGDGADDPAFGRHGRRHSFRQLRFRHRLARPRRARGGQHGRPSDSHRPCLRSIQHTVRYTELAPTRFEDFWKD
jgi:glycosyltransferase involved in cell wall biosynthesis